jgi:hypothetical protein
MMRFQMKLQTIRPKFVRLIPETIEDGILYISIPFATATHKCACGCGEEVVTPVRPADWALTWNGEKVTLKPSIGNWSFQCQSHYWIIENRIVWARKWSPKQIEAGRAIDRNAKARYYGKLGMASRESEEELF